MSLLAGLYLVGLAVNLIVLALASFTPSMAGQRRRIWTWGLAGAVLWPVFVICLLLRHRARLKLFAKRLKAQ